MNENLIEPTRKVVALLVAGKYVALEALTDSRRLTAEEIMRAVGDYGKKLVLPPREGFQIMDAVEVKNAKPRRWSIALPLWTQEEGRSDLTLEMTIIEKNNGFSIELDDLHVL